MKPVRTIGQPKYFSPLRQDLLSQVAAPATLNVMTKLTGVGYGMDKLNQAGIPDFGPGAMENWGLVTYRSVIIGLHQAPYEIDLCLTGIEIISIIQQPYSII